MDILALVLALIALASPASGYGAGAPIVVCETMVPGHGGTAQTAAAPYSLSVDYVKNGCSIDSISVRLAGTGGATFRGFLCQARATVDSDTTVGTLEDDDDHLMFATNCGVGSITHSEKSDKSSAKFKWMKSSETSHLYIVCSVVQTQSTYWVKAVNAHVSPCSSAARVTLAFLVSVGVLFAYVI